MRLIDADALIESLMVDPVECYGCPEPEDYGLPEGGLIHECQCADCGARITYYVDIPEEADD